MKGDIPVLAVRMALAHDLALTPKRGVSCPERAALAGALAASLPSAPGALNLCEHRDNFLVAFVALLMRGQACPLPPSRASAVIDEVMSEHPGCYCVDDALVDRCRAAAAATRLVLPAIEPDRIVVVGYTSGSTGRPHPNPKTWRTFVAATAFNAAHVMRPEEETMRVVMELALQSAGLPPTVRLEGSASLQTAHGPKAVTYFWSRVGGPTVEMSDTSRKQIEFTPTMPGQYRLALTVRDLWQPSRPAVVTVEVPMLGDVDADGDIDRTDVKQINAAINTAASRPNDVRDLNGDLQINKTEVDLARDNCTVGSCGGESGGGTVDLWLLLAGGMLSAAGVRRRRKTRVLMKGRNERDQG